MGRRKKIAFYQNFLGRTLPVLFEQQYEGYWEGFSENYMRIKVRSEQNLKNEILPVKLIEIDGEKIIGELL